MATADKDKKYKKKIVEADKKTLVGRAIIDSYYKPRTGEYKSTTGRKTRYYTGGGF